ncbi:MAG: oligopeptide transport system ATP-binding protein [Pseudonocardiales bacterium]|nr:oligopeptide transport system ATP-binding protein [Pseudonocardiales bacterium]
MNDPVLRVEGLVKRFTLRSRGTVLTAVDGIDLQVAAGETVALIGESGSGKSTVARCIARLVEPTAGEVLVAGRDLTAAPKSSVWRFYDDLQMVFQDPSSALNPRMTARQTIEEPLRMHTSSDRMTRAAAVDDLLDQVGLRRDLGERYPRQLSGGECQRVAIARALAVDPKVLLLDEPTASLDVSVRGHVLDLLERLQAERDLAYLFISHDLEVVRHIADRVLVMYLGVIVEEGTAVDVFERPTHPYTRALLSAAPVAEYGPRPPRLRLAGEIPSPTDLPPGCRLATRCPLALSACSNAPPPSIAVSATHFVRCPVVAGTPSLNTQMV